MTNSLAVNLRRFRKLKKLTQKQLADAARISRVAYRNLETGRSKPRERTLESLAQELNVDVFELLMDSPTPQSVRFRSRKTLTAQERAEREQVIVSTHYWLCDFRELESMLKKDIPSHISQLRQGSKTIAQFAESTRKKLGVTCDACAPNICDVLENAGVKVRLFESTSDKINGFSIGVEDGGPAVAVNTLSSIPVERQIFSAAHELGHLLLHQDSYDSSVDGENDTEEKQATSFASYFLMPDRQFRTEWDRNCGLHWVERVIKTKRTFKVSWMTVLFRLCDHGEASRSQIFRQFKQAYKRLTNKAISSKEEPEPVGGPLHRSAEPSRLDHYDFYEDRFSGLVRSAIENKVLGVSRAAEMLGKKVAEVRALVHEWEAFG